jgi:hypothetical protein
LRGKRNAALEAGRDTNGRRRWQQGSIMRVSIYERLLSSKHPLWRILRGVAIFGPPALMLLLALSLYMNAGTPN